MPARSPSPVLAPIFPPLTCGFRVRIRLGTRFGARGGPDSYGQCGGIDRRGAEEADVGEQQAVQTTDTAQQVGQVPVLDIGPVEPGLTFCPRNTQA
ncbi:hypothetical protein GCM10010483_46990 [Actinokineospora diospyrosa]